MHEFSVFEKIYRQASIEIIDKQGLFKALNQWYLTYPQNNFLHPCIIDGKAALVCQENLSNAVAYSSLQKIADQYGIFLKENKRAKNNDYQYISRRNKIPLVLTFCFSLLEVSNVAAQITNGMVVSHFSSQATSAMVTSSPSAAHQADQSASLQDTLNRITAVSGVKFIVNTDISKDKAIYIESSDDLYNSIKGLLTGYSWVAIKDKDSLKEVIITGKSSYYEAPVESVAKAESIAYAADDTVDPSFLRNRQHQNL